MAKTPRNNKPAVDTSGTQEPDQTQATDLTENSASEDTSDKSEEIASSEDTSSQETSESTDEGSDKNTEESTSEVKDVEEAPVEETSNDEPEFEDPKVNHLNDLLRDFVEANNVSGDTPDHFANSARLANVITQYVINNPTIPVLNHLKDFFIANADGVCSAKNYMKGSTTLNFNDEQQVGFLYNLFKDIASGVRPRKNEALIIQVLKRIEILEYYGKFAA